MLGGTWCLEHMDDVEERGKQKA